MNNFNQYFIPLLLGVWAITFGLSLGLYAFIEFSHRGSGRAIATTPAPPDEPVKRGDGRHE